MSRSASFSPPARRAPITRFLTRLFVVWIAAVGLLPIGLVRQSVGVAIEHLVVSEVVTGGASANDELIELYNPSTSALPLEGLELVYVSSTGVTVTRRASWELGAEHVPVGAHLLIANEAGVFAPIADATYAGGMAATGGSVALRIQGATTPVDAVGWGTATGAWLEGRPVAAPPSGASIERLPGGSAGSTVDTDDNAADFVVRSLPDPQNAGSPPVPEPAFTPSPTGEPSPTEGPSPTATPLASMVPSPTATPAPTEAPAPTATLTVPIGTARALPDGAIVTIEGIALTGSGFADGGGFIADATGGIAVLLDAGSFARGERVLVTGSLDDRFAQRTLRAAVALGVSSGGAPPEPAAQATGSVNETEEGRLVRLDAMIDSGATVLSGGVAFDVDDGSGIARVVVGNATGIDTVGWVEGRGIEIVGVVGQRDSSGSGTSGYRVQPRDPADIELAALSAPTPTPAGGSASPSPSPTATPAGGEVRTIAQARAAASNARLTVRGVVTLASGTIDPDSAVIQDATGAILLRLGEEAGRLERGQLVEVDGVRSTKSGMESLRASVPPRRIGSAAEPAPRELRTGDPGEMAEAQLVVARGAIVANARRASSGTVSFEIDDGSGPLRVVLGAALGANDDDLASGSWVEVVGVLGQETSGSQPTLGYRIWPRDAGEVRILAAAAGSVGGSGEAGDGGGGGTPSAGGGAADESLAAIGAGSLADLRVGATLVTAAWAELELAGLLWDGSRLVGIDASSRGALERAITASAPPVALELGGLSEAGSHARLAIPIVSLGSGAGDVVRAAMPPAQPLTHLPAPDEPAAWVSVVGRLSRAGDRTTLAIDGVSVEVEQLCPELQQLPAGVASVRGVGLGSPAQIIVPCDGIGPAPRLALAADEAGPEPRPIDEGRDLAAVGERAATDPLQRGIAVALLAAGAAVLLLAGLIGRRLGPPDGADTAPAEPPGAGESPDGPQLTLVRVPREHGP